MSKRVKHIFDSKQVAHLWATLGSQSDARNSSNNVFFSSDSVSGIRTLYSYRTSYPIASTFSRGIGKAYKQIFLLRSGSAYSVTTAKHFSFARQAAHGNFQFTVPCFVAPLNPEHHEINVKHYRDEIQTACDKLDNTKLTCNVSWRISALKELREQAELYAKTFRVKLGKTAKPKKDFSPETLAAMEARQAELNRTRDARMAIKHAETIAKWRTGENVSLHFGRHNYGFNSMALLRIVGSEVQTSLGARVPILGNAGAAKLFRFLKFLKENGRTYQRNGHTEHIGQFTVDGFDGETLKAGCHRIAWDEINALGEHVLRCEYNLQLETDLKTIAY